MSRWRSPQRTAINYYLVDGLGSVIGRIDSNTDALSETTNYTVWGQSAMTAYNGYPFGFTGREKNGDALLELPRPPVRPARRALPGRRKGRRKSRRCRRPSVAELRHLEVHIQAARRAWL